MVLYAVHNLHLSLSAFSVHKHIVGNVGKPHHPTMVLYAVHNLHLSLSAFSVHKHIVGNVGKLHNSTVTLLCAIHHWSSSNIGFHFSDFRIKGLPGNI